MVGILAAALEIAGSLETDDSEKNENEYGQEDAYEDASSSENR